MRPTPEITSVIKAIINKGFNVLYSSKILLTSATHKPSIIPAYVTDVQVNFLPSSQKAHILQEFQGVLGRYYTEHLVR